MHIYTTCSGSQFPELLLMNWSQDDLTLFSLNFSLRPRCHMQIASALSSPATDSNVCTSLYGLRTYKYAAGVSSSHEIRVVGHVSTMQNGLEHPIAHPESLSNKSLLS